MKLRDLIQMEHILHNNKCIIEEVNAVDKLDGLQYLWTTDKDKYYLEIMDGMFSIMDINNTMLLIEDDKLYLSTMEKMIDNGVKVIERDNTTKKGIVLSCHKAMQKYREFKDSI